MLELRPNCEHCDKDLPPNANDAMICSFECTFCLDCVTTKLSGVCPNCYGNFAPRPIRPTSFGKNNNDLIHHPATTARLFRPVDLDQHTRGISVLRDRPIRSHLSYAISNHAAKAANDE
jgi:hypothetical protein